ncbi:alpha/beta fold hydrolase [Hyphomonas johnsonii]|uniref:Alpha/beta fold family hydrolase n=1 Tax=Hyphomonas johnsonii MHS-2 TaxID=1280950 RepID=A0A059FTP5_9PROT|nr:alpha/beta fold hydrolase [Hyphomonas johnsonii]KCZ93891.1 alpha/beta fold family hydrolase [Hyphomonas johnsonii MHS-2]
MIRLAALAFALTALPLTVARAEEAPAMQTYDSFDGTTISYQELGTGPLVVLLHGFTSNADQNFFQPGIAQKIAAAGYHVVAPDLRGHGASPYMAPPENWPGDAVARDQIALIAHLGDRPYATVGYSMGAISALRWHLLSRETGRMALGGIGDSAADEFNTDRNTAFRTAILEAMAGDDTPGAKGMRARAKATGGTLEGYLGALSARTYTPADLLATFDVPTLILTGDEDLDNGSGPGLAALIPDARYHPLTGTHLTAVLDPEFPRAIIAFLDEGRGAE